MTQKDLDKSNFENSAMVAEIDNVVQNILTELSFDSLEVKEVKFDEGDLGRTLFIILDGPDGVTIGQCSRVAKRFLKFMESIDGFREEYYLEVSSPGVVEN